MNQLSSPVSPFSVQTVTLALLGGLLSGCGISGSGVIEERTRSLESFDAIEVADGFEASVVMADDYSVTVWVDDNIIDDVRIISSAHAVKVDLRNTSVHNATLEVEFTLPELASIKLEDGSALSASQVTLADNLNIQLHDGSRLDLSPDEDERLDFLNIVTRDGSRCDLDTRVSEGTVRLSDGSRVALQGRAERMTLNASDGSNFNGRALETGNLNFQLSDGSHAAVHVKGTARGQLRDGSQLDVWGGANVEADKSDGSHVALKD